MESRWRQNGDAALISREKASMVDAIKQNDNFKAAIKIALKSSPDESVCNLLSHHHLGDGPPGPHSDTTLGMSEGNSLLTT